MTTIIDQGLTGTYLLTQGYAFALVPTAPILPGYSVYVVGPQPGVAVANPVVVSGGSAFGTGIFGTAVFGMGVAGAGSARSQVPSPGVAVPV